MDKNKSHHILIIRLSAMGDVAMLVPILSALTIAYPDVKITLLTRKHLAPIFASFSTITIITADVKHKHKGVLGLYKLYIELKKQNITAVADIHNVLRSTILKFFFKITSIPFVQINKGRKEKAALIRTTNKKFKQLKTTHKRYADVFEVLGYKIDFNKVQALDKAGLSNPITSVIGEKNKRWIGIAPFAAHKSKSYPLDLMKEVIAELAENKAYKILLFGGGKEEVEKLNAISKEYVENVICVAGKFTFKEELDLISNLDVMLSMDSGNGHLAANYGVPVITLWGVTHPYAGFAPFGQAEDNSLLSNREEYPLIPTSIYGNKFPQGYDKAIASITPNSITRKVIALTK